MSIVPICSLCNKLFSSKYTLKKHVLVVHQKPQRQEEPEPVEDFNCTSANCSYTTRNKSDLKRHLEKCQYTKLERELSKQKLELTEEFNREKQKLIEILEKRLVECEFEKSLILKDMQIQVERANVRADILQTQLEHANKLNERAIDRPTTSTSSTISVTNNNILAKLADPATYQEYINPNRILSIARENMEDLKVHFFRGQRGLAAFLVKYILRTDEGKYLLICTDVARKRLRCLIAGNQLIDDLHGRMLLQHIASSVRQVSNEAYAQISDEFKAKIKNAKCMGKGEFEIDIIQRKADHAAEIWIQILDFDNDDQNADFTSELASLLQV